MVLIRTNYKIAIALMLALFGFFLIGKEAIDDILSHTSCIIFTDFEKKIGDIEQRYTIELEYESEKIKIPELWSNPPANGAAEAIAQSNLCRAVTILSRELKKYPAIKQKADLVKRFYMNISDDFHLAF